jgi:hypothetical protein
MIKKVAKALDEMAKNEELMEGILAAAVGMDEDGRVGGGEIEQPEGEERLGTIGEDGEEDRQIYDTQNQGRSKSREDDGKKDSQQEEDYEF